MKTKITNSLLIEELKSKSPKEIGEKYGYHTGTIQRKIREFKIKRTRHNHLIKHDFFKTINHDSAYILGFIYADGTINKSKEHCYVCIQLKRTDEEILQYIRDKIQPTSKIYHYERIDKKTEKSYYISHLSFASKILAQDLESLGCVPNKTYKEIRLPEIPKEFYPDFIRGVFDGDGSVSISKDKKKINCYICCSSLSFLLDIQKLLKFGTISTSDFPHRLNFCSIENRDKFYNYIYNGNFYLQRKFKKLTEVIKKYEL